MPAPQLADKEKRQILRYCAYPKFAAAALVMAFASAVLILPLEMVDDLVFHNKGFDPAGLYTALAFVVLNLVVFCYCTLSPKFGMRGERWRSLQERLRVPQTEADRSAQVAGVLAAQAAGRLLKNSDSDATRGLGDAAEIAGAVGAIATAADILSEISGNAEAMAEAYGLPVPNAKKQLIAFVAVPIAVIVGFYVPQKPGAPGEDLGSSGAARARRGRIRPRLRARRGGRPPRALPGLRLPRDRLPARGRRGRAGGLRLPLV